jgi:hypothetical protein
MQSEISTGQTITGEKEAKEECESAKDSQKFSWLTILDER